MMPHCPPRWPQALARMLATLLPCACALCGARCDAPVCPACRLHYLAPRTARCRRWAYDATLAAADYAGPLDQLVLQLKFGGALALAPWFAEAMREALRLQPGFELPNVLCPVPLGPERLVERGFNQALEIARPLSAALGIPLRPRLAIRALDTRAQSAVKPAERRANIRNAFIVAPDGLAMVRGQHIGIVDDVMTSGSTLNELAATFKRFGAARVSNFVFARTPPH